MGALRELTWGRRKTVDDAVAGTEEEGFTLKRELTALDLTVLGIGAIIGTGIFVLTGKAIATEAGPGDRPVVRPGRRHLRVRRALPTPSSPPRSRSPAAPTRTRTRRWASSRRSIIGWDLDPRVHRRRRRRWRSAGPPYFNRAARPASSASRCRSRSPARPRPRAASINLPAVVHRRWSSPFLLVRGIRVTAKTIMVITAITLAVLAARHRGRRLRVQRGQLGARSSRRGLGRDRGRRGGHVLRLHRLRHRLHHRRGGHGTRSATCRSAIIGSLAIVDRPLHPRRRRRDRRAALRRARRRRRRWPTPSRPSTGRGRPSSISVGALVAITSVGAHRCSTGSRASCSR